MAKYYIRKRNGLWHLFWYMAIFHEIPKRPYEWAHGQYRVESLGEALALVDKFEAPKRERENRG